MLDLQIQIQNIINIINIINIKIKKILTIKKNSDLFY
jgi:hypothetical protein